MAFVDTINADNLDSLRMIAFHHKIFVSVFVFFTAGAQFLADKKVPPAYENREDKSGRRVLETSMQLRKDPAGIAGADPLGGCRSAKLRLV